MTDITDEQRAKAEELGIAIRGRMTAETLQMRIDNAMGVTSDTEAPSDVATPEPSEPMETVKIIKDGYRPASDTAENGGLYNLMRYGDIVELPKSEAARCVKLRIATRDIEYEPEVVDSWATHDGITS